MQVGNLTKNKKMKNINLIIKSFLMLVLVLLASCSPETYSLEGITDKADIQYDILQDFKTDAGGNTVILTNKTPGVVLNWDYVTGKSDKASQTVQYAFKGDYNIKILAITAGGIVELDPVTVSVTQDNLNYVNDPLWTALSGGVGKKKSWIADNGKYGMAPGAMSFADPTSTQEWGNFTPNWEPEGNANSSSDADMHWGRYMTFSLDGGPFMTTYEADGTAILNGTYFLDVNTHTLTTTGATILRPDNYIANASNWTNNIKVLKLTENQLRIGILRTNSEGPWLYIWNFVSKEYADNYIPLDVPDPNPAIDLNNGTVDDLLSTTTTTTKTWALSKDTPFNWSDLNGALLNDWNSAADYEAAGWTGYLVSDQTNVVKNKISFSNDGKVTTVDSNGLTKAGTYATDPATNTITFKDISPSFSIGSSWASVATTEENQWKIVKTAKTGTVVTDIWFGKRDPSKKEYMVFHFVLSAL